MELLIHNSTLKYTKRRFIMTKNYADEFRADLVEFREITRKFYNKEITVPEYKSVSGGFGSYAQRGGNEGMLRLRLCGGRITKDYLSFITDSVEKYNIDLIHMTTCQSIQLHNLSVDTICTLIEEAWDHGIITRGGGGDFPRNVMSTPLTGVMKEEAFPLTPYIEAVGDYLLQFIKAVKLPRKLKVCFSSTPDNYPHATFRDLGFVAKENGTFDVYSAGGLGPRPKLGLLVDENVDPSKVLYYVKAMVDTFVTYGNYTQRNKARTRFMQESLGEEGYVNAFQEKLREAFASESLDLTITPVEFHKTGDGTITNPRVVEQKQEGLYSVFYQPVGGNIVPSVLRELTDAIVSMEEVEIRLTPTEGMYIINLTASEAEKILAITADHAANLFETSVACVGSNTCQSGLGDSQGLLSRCVEAVRPYNFKDGVLPRIYISGCPSSCSAHTTAILGFRGAMKKTDEGMKPAFAMFENGCDLQGQERFGTDAGVMTVEDIPNFFIDLGQAITAANSTYAEWIQTNHDEFEAIAAKYI